MKADIHDKLSKPFKWLKEIGKQELINFATGEVCLRSDECGYERPYMEITQFPTTNGNGRMEDKISDLGYEPQSFYGQSRLYDYTNDDSENVGSGVYVPPKDKKKQ